MPPSDEDAARDLARLARASLKESLPAAQALDGRFERLEVLGSGAMGVVWRARDRQLGREVALKVLAPGLEGHPEGVARLRREAETLARLHHPGIVPLLDVVGSPLALVLELVRGEPLSALLARGETAPRDLAALVAKIARAAHHAHEHGLVHRDLKPSNVLVTLPLEPRIVDWGIARLLDDPAPLTRTGAVLGTAGYMAPEQAAGRSREVDARADVYSLGAILHEVVAGEPPRGTSRGDGPDLRALAPWISPALESLLRRALEGDPARRTPSAVAFADELEPILGDASLWEAAERARTARRAQARPSPERVPVAPLAPGERLGSLVLVELLGQGGMGEVYRARDEQLGRDVAVKVVRRGRETPRNAARFAREIEAASRIRHPNLVAVHSAGTHHGHPYLVTELVRGEGLDLLLARRGPFPVREVASIGRRVALALDELHRGGVIHRDVKPANILLDERSEPRLLDFGIAKVEDQGALTRTGELLGSPIYAAPEQLGNAATAGPGADVYALGATLSELATGSPPFAVGSLLALIRAKQMPTPSVSSRRADGDPSLDAVVRRCLEEEPGSRYATALELAQALEAVERGAPPRSRRPLVAGAIALGAAGLVLALAWQLRGVGADSVACPVPSPSPGATSPAPSARPVAESPVSIEPALAPRLASCARTKHTRLVTAIGTLAWRHPRSTIGLAVLPGGARALSVTDAGLMLLWDLDTGEVVGAFDRGSAGHVLGARHLAVTDDGRLAVEVDAAGGLVLWDTAARRAVRRVEHAGSELRAVSPGASGRHALVALEHSIEQWDLESGEVRVRSEPVEGRLIALARAPGDVAVAIGPDAVAVWNPATPRPSVRRIPDAALRGVAVQPDGTVLAVGGEGIVRRFGIVPELAELAPWTGARERLLAVASLADGKLVWTGGDEHGLRSWNAGTGEPSELLAPGPAPVLALAVDPTSGRGLAVDAGGRLVAFGAGGVARAPAGPGHEAGVVAVAVGAGGSTAVTAGLDGTVRSWDLASRRERWCRRFAARACSLALSSDGDCVAAGLLSGEVACLSAATGEALPSPGGVVAALQSPGGASVAFLGRHKLAFSSGRRIALFDVETGREGGAIEGAPAHVDGLVALGGSRLATLDATKVQVWNADRAALLAEWANPHTTPLSSLAAADGERAVVGAWSGAHVLDVARARSVGEVATGEHVTAVAARGALAAVGLASGRTLLVRLDSVVVLDEIDLGSSFDVPTALAFSPDGAALVVGTARGLVLRFELGRELVPPR